MHSSNKIPILYLIISSVFLHIHLAIGQDTDSLKSKKGNFSLQYQIGSNLDVNSFNSSFLSIKYTPKNNFVYLFGLSGYYRLMIGDSKTTVNEELYTFPGDESSYDFGLYVQIHYQIKTSKNMLFYLGLGPFVGGSYTEYSGYSYYRSRIPSFSPDVRTYRKKYIGISFNVGGEYFLMKKLSFIAESSLEPLFLKKTQKYVESNTSYTESSSLDGWEVDTFVRVGFAFHFSR